MAWATRAPAPRWQATVRLRCCTCRAGAACAWRWRGLRGPRSKDTGLIRAAPPCPAAPRLSLRRRSRSSSRPDPPTPPGAMTGCCWSARAEQGRDRLVLLLQLRAIGGGPLRQGCAQRGGVSLQLTELEQQALQIGRIERLAETPEAHLLHQGVVFRLVGKRHHRLTEQQRQQHVVKARGDDEIHAFELRQQLL